MNLEDIKKELEKIQTYVSDGDDEYAHEHEKYLWKHVLEEIANGNSNSKELAQEALKTVNIRFSRWFA